MLDFPEGDITYLSAMGGEAICEAGIFQRIGKGRSFRGVRAAGSIRARSARMLAADQTRREVNRVGVRHHRRDITARDEEDTMPKKKVLITGASGLVRIRCP